MNQEIKIQTSEGIKTMPVRKIFNYKLGGKSFKFAIQESGDLAEYTTGVRIRQKHQLDAIKIFCPKLSELQRAKKALDDLVLICEISNQKFLEAMAANMSKFQQVNF